MNDSMSNFLPPTVIDSQPKIPRKSLFQTVNPFNFKSLDKKTPRTFQSSLHYINEIRSQPISRQPSNNIIRPISLQQTHITTSSLKQDQIFHQFMAAIQASNLLTSSSSSSSPFSHRRIGGVVATLQTRQTRKPYLSFPKLPTRNLIEELSAQKPKEVIIRTNGNGSTARNDDETQDSMVMAELYMIMETVAERVEMHNNIGEQRNNWNNLLLNSINAITITAATMTGLASTTAVMGSPLLALKISSTLLYTAATGMLLVMNKIQPSQLAEEQRNAVRLFKQLHSQIQTTIALGNPTSMDVKNAMANVLALDRAFPLPLLGGVMIEKFPETVKPAVWWPQQQKQQNLNENKGGKNNGWSGKLEEEMMEIVGVLKNKDTEEYVRLSEMVLKINKILAISGPLLTGIAACGSAFVGTSPFGSAAVLCGVVGGAMATVVNTLEHGGQVGMVFEMYRNCAGSFGLLQETIESTLKEREVEKRENGELFEMKVALKLGRSLSELRNLAFSSSRNEDHSSTEKFASKLF